MPTYLQAKQNPAFQIALAQVFLAEYTHHTRLLPLVIHMCETYWTSEISSLVLSHILSHKILELSVYEVNSILAVKVPKFQCRWNDPVAKSLIARQYRKTELLLRAGLDPHTRLQSFNHKFYCLDGGEVSIHPIAFSVPELLAGKTVWEAILLLGLFDLHKAIKTGRSQTLAAPQLVDLESPPAFSDELSQVGLLIP